MITEPPASETTNVTNEADKGTHHRRSSSRDRHRREHGKHGSRRDEGRHHDHGHRSSGSSRRSRSRDRHRDHHRRGRSPHRSSRKVREDVPLSDELLMSIPALLQEVIM